MEDPIALPPFDFDPSLSEDDNFLTWATVLARMSFSKKGHMGAIVVRPPNTSDPTLSINLQSQVTSDPDDNLLVKEAKSRVLIHGNNTPLLYNTTPKQVPEIHAEALCISRSAKEGIRLKDSTIYVTFPPCHECFRLICGAGIKRCVYRKTISSPHGDAAIVAARVLGIELCGTSDFNWKDLPESERAKTELETSASAATEDGSSNHEGKIDSSSASHQTKDKDPSSSSKDQISKPRLLPTPEQIEMHREITKKRDADSELRARQAWIKMGETAQVTRNRVKQWWKRWNQIYSQEAKALKEEGRIESGNPTSNEKVKQGKEEKNQGKKGKKGKGKDANGSRNDEEVEENFPDETQMEELEDEISNQRKVEEMEEDQINESTVQKQPSPPPSEIPLPSDSVGKRKLSASQEMPNKEARVE